jgi:hypothetical protein
VGAASAEHRSSLELALARRLLGFRAGIREFGLTPSSGTRVAIVQREKSRIASRHWIWNPKLIWREGARNPALISVDSAQRVLTKAWIAANRSKLINWLAAFHTKVLSEAVPLSHAILLPI